MFVICFISQWMERTKHGLFVFPPKKTLIWRRHCSIDQSCCSMTSKQFLESSSGMKFVYPSVRLANQKPGAFVSVRYTNQIALFPFVCVSILLARFHFKVIRKSLYFVVLEKDSDMDPVRSLLGMRCVLQDIVSDPGLMTVRLLQRSRL